MKATLLWSFLPLVRFAVASPQTSLNVPFASKSCQCAKDLYIAPCTASACECRNRALMTCWLTLPISCNIAFMSCPAHPITKDYPRCGQIGTPACSANRYCRQVDGACKPGLTGCVGVCVPYSITAQPPPLSDPGYSSNFPPAKQSPPPQPQQPQQPQGPNWGTPLQQQQQTPPQQPPPQQSPPQQPPPQQPPPQQPPPQQPPPQQPPLQQPPPQQPQPQQPQSGVGGQPNKPLAKCPDNLGCPDNLVCIADPRDELTASRGTSFMCVEGGAEATCAGFKNIQCPNGGICVADPRIECFGAGCTGVCA